MKKTDAKVLSISKIFPSYTGLITIAAVLYVFLFIFLYFYLLKTPITFGTFWDFHLRHPVLFYVEILPFLVYFFTVYVINDFTRQVRDIEEDVIWLNAKNRAIYNFVEQLRRGNTEVNFSNEFLQDRVIQSLVLLRDEIKRSRIEEEKRRKEEQQRNWINKGLAEFSTILRENVDDLNKLAEKVTSYLTKYMDAKQAAFFIVTEEKGDKFLDMIAFFAYDRKKFPDKRLIWGEGLIGAAAIEKNILVLNDTTENFVEVTSGLGGANPRAILISPLIDDDEVVHGVLELASFNKFEQYHVEFIEQVSKSIASTIANIKRNLQTQQLLKESQEQAEILAKQEERMRRNMEELQALQQEAAKQSEEFISFTNSVNKAFLRAEFSNDGFLIYANENFVNALGYRDYFEIANKHFTVFLIETERESFDTLWQDIVENGNVVDRDMHFVTYDGKDRWISSALMPVKTKQGELVKILFLGLDRTQEKEFINEQLAAMHFADNVIMRLGLDLNGNIIEVNKNFLALLGYKQEEIVDKPFTDLFSVEEAQEFGLIWRNISSGKAHIATHKIITSYKTHIWLEAYYFAYIVENSIQKIIVIGLDVSDRVKAQEALRQKEEEIRTKDELFEQQTAKFNEEKSKLESKLQSEQTLRFLYTGLFDQLDQAVVIIDDTEHIVLFNRYAEELWKVKRDVVLGKRLSALLPELPEDVGLDDVNYLLEYFNATKPLLNTSRLSYIIDKAGNRVNVGIYIVRSEYSGKALIAAFVKNMEL